MDHYNCECHETCFFCLTLTPINLLLPWGEAEMVCAACRIPSNLP